MVDHLRAELITSQSAPLPKSFTFNKSAAVNFAGGGVRTGRRPEIRAGDAFFTVDRTERVAAFLPFVSVGIGLTSIRNYGVASARIREDG